ncbi:unnamed protein product [Porites lobata]|uniref:Uncharacterized protein n=1 Tax=Porites lobata TaxID=104759 RepID=A0ABN8ND81_9CNID|nr:unnamed protein product [Porites lobata]
MSLETFPPSDMTSTASSSVSDERTPLMRSDSALSRQTSAHQSTSGIFRGHLPSMNRNRNSLFPLACIILAVVLERITFYGILANLVLYLINMTKFSQSAAVGTVMIFTGMAWLMSTVGGIVADSYSGRYNAVWGSLMIYIVGAGMIFYSALLTDTQYPVSDGCNQLIVLLALLVISIGEGAYKANITAFGADQLQGHDDNRYRRFFNWYYWGINVASFTAYAGLAYVEQEFTFSLAFGILLACIALASVVFCVCRSRYITQPPAGHLLKKMYHIVKEARLKKKEASKRENSPQFYPGLQEYMPTTKSWLDHAMMKYGGTYLDTDVEEVKTIGRIMIIFAIFIPYWTIYFQMNSTFLLQGLHMRLSFDPHDMTEDIDEAHVIPAWLTLVDVSFVLILIPIMDKLVYPWLDRKGWGLSIFTRISIGFLFAVGSMVVAGIVEIKRRNDDHHCVTQTIANVNYTACMSIYYQIPQYGLIGVSEVFASVAALEFAYREAPKTMQSLVMGLFFFVQSIGSLLGGALYELCSLGKHSWTPHLGNMTSRPQALKNHLDYYFFLLAGLLFGTWIIFLVVTLRCKFPFRQSNRRRTIPVIRKSQENLHTTS